MERGLVESGGGAAASEGLSAESAFRSPLRQATLRLLERKIEIREIYDKTLPCRRKLSTGSGPNPAINITFTGAESGLRARYNITVKDRKPILVEVM